MAVAVGTTSTLALGNRTNSTVTAPASIANGDLLLCILNAGDSGDTTPPTVTGPAGFTKVTGSPFPLTYGADPNYAGGINVFWKIASGESGSYIFTHSAADTQAIMYRITGHDPTTPLNPTLTSNAHTGGSGTGKLATALGLTTATNDSLVIYAVALWDGGPGVQPSGSTPTFTERVDSGGQYIADGVLATAGATGNKVNATAFTAQSTDSPWRALLIAVQAATAAAKAHPIFHRPVRFR